MTDHSIKRNYLDQPWVMPPGAGPLTGEWRDGKDRQGKPKRWWYSSDAVPYARMSATAKTLDTKENLVDWAAAQAAVGVLLDSSARSEIVTLINEFDGDPWSADQGQRSGKDRLKAAVEQARTTAGQHVASSAGTEFHKLGELVNQGQEPRLVQDHLKPLLSMYKTAVEPIRFLRQELLVVNDELQRAGSLDYLLQVPDGRVLVSDLKGLALDTKLPTPTGWTTMGEVRVGDEVFGSDGKPCTVTAKSDTKRIGTFVVTFDDGAEVTCDSEHLWWTAAHHDFEPQVRSVQEVRNTLYYRGRQRQHRVPIAGALELGAIALDIPPYLLGCWIGDGHVRGGVISKQDDLFEVLESDGIELGRRQVTHGRESVVTRTVLGLTAHLRKLGLLHNKHIPAAYLRGSYDQRLALLQGLMDTDGGWNSIRKRAVFSSTERVLADQVVELLLSLGEKAKVHQYEAFGYGKQVTAYSVEFTPASFMPFRLPRKAAKVDLGDKRIAISQRRMIVSVEPGPDVETACIAVDSANRTYLCTENFIPTHNTGKWDVRYPMSVTTQVAAAATAVVYDQATGERRPIHPDLDTTTGLLVHFPIMLPRPRVQFYELNLELGMRAARVAKDIEDLRNAFKRKGAELKELVIA